jgi:hypothetical protein
MNRYQYLIDHLSLSNQTQGDFSFLFVTLKLAAALDTEDETSGNIAETFVNQLRSTVGQCQAVDRIAVMLQRTIEDVNSGRVPAVVGA